MDNETSHVWDFMSEFTEALRVQLEDDERRWGNTWQHREIGNQEERIYNEYRAYYDQWKFGGNDIPWLKIAGLAMIAWIRENFPESLLGE